MSDRMVPCKPCAGTGEYPPTGGAVCSWCDGRGEVGVARPTESDDEWTDMPHPYIEAQKDRAPRPTEG